MSYSSSEETAISESELDEYVDRCYEELKDGDEKVKLSEESYRCPYCPGRKKLHSRPYHDLIQHASDVGKDSKYRDIKHKGKHLSLVRYMKNDLDRKSDLSLEFDGLTLDNKLPQCNGVNYELFVWPWMGILVNVDVDRRNGNHAKASARMIRKVLSKRGFDPVRVRPLLSGKYAVVEFKKVWSGFYSAMMFEKEFSIGGFGKKDYYYAEDRSCFGDKLYGWVARDDDYNSKGCLGEFLQMNGDLKSFGDLEDDEERKAGLLIADLRSKIEELRVRLDELQGFDP